MSDPTEAQRAGREACYCPEMPGCHWHPQYACGAINPVTRTVCVMPPHGPAVSHIGNGEAWHTPDPAFNQERREAAAEFMAWLYDENILTLWNPDEQAELLDKWIATK